MHYYCVLFDKLCLITIERDLSMFQIRTRIYATLASRFACMPKRETKGIIYVVLIKTPQYSTIQHVIYATPREQIP